jgi:hypothetical protein
VVEIETATPKCKEFIEALMTAPFYDPATFSFNVRHPESIFASEDPQEETHPIVRPTTDVYEELWQFTKVTISLVGRVFLSAVLLSYGMVEDFLPLIIAGLLFLPYHHHMLGIGLGGVMREWRFLRQGLMALLITTAIISPGTISTELLDAISDPKLKSEIVEVSKIGIEPASIARAIAFAIEQPSDVAVNEMIIRPTVQEL